MTRREVFAALCLLVLGALIGAELLIILIGVDIGVDCP